MTNHDSQVRKLAEAISGSAPEAAPAFMVQGTVVSNDGTTLTVNLRGGDVSGIHWFVDAYATPTAGDTIWLIKNGPTYMALGQLS